MLPPAILPSECLDTPDIRYMNSDFSPINHPFANSMDIESYNVDWFDDALPSRVPIFLRGNILASVSSVRALLLSESFLWDDASGSWNQPVISNLSTIVVHVYFLGITQLL